MFKSATCDHNKIISKFLGHIVKIQYAVNIIKIQYIFARRLPSQVYLRRFTAKETRNTFSWILHFQEIQKSYRAGHIGVL